MFRHINRRGMKRDETEVGEDARYNRLTDDLVDELKSVYYRMTADRELSIVAFGVLSDYLMKHYGLSYSEAADIIDEFPIFFDSIKEVLSDEHGRGRFHNRHDDGRHSGND
jgi:hypothetical protein